jgi:hypothetical protein
MDLEKKIKISFDFDGTFIQQHTGFDLAKQAIKYNQFNLCLFLKNFRNFGKEIKKDNIYLSILACIINGFPYEKAKKTMENVTLKEDTIKKTVEDYLKKGLIKTKEGLVEVAILTYNDTDRVNHSLSIKTDELKKMGIYISEVIGCNFEKVLSENGEFVYNGNLNPICKQKILIDNPNLIHHDCNYHKEFRKIPNFKVIR